MKKIINLFKVVFAICLLLGLAVSAQDKPKGKPWLAPESAVKAKNPIKSDDATLKEGKELYAQHCKSCHGSKGLGDGTKAEKIDISCSGTGAPHRIAEIKRLRCFRLLITLKCTGSSFNRARYSLTARRADW